MRTAARLTGPLLLSLTLSLWVGAPALARPDDEETSVILLTDGQTLEGIVRIEGPTVRILVKNGAESAEIVLAAESVKSINPRHKPDQVLDDAAVRLKDGRTLRGRAVRFKGFVRVQGAHGEVEVASDEVLSIEIAEAPRARLLVDGDLGIALPVPKGWSEDDPTGLGERLRVVDEDAQCFVSVIARTLPEGDSTLAQVRAALLGDLGPRAQVTPRGDLIWIEDEVRAPGSDSRSVRNAGWVHLVDDLLVWFRATTPVNLPRNRREATEALAKRAKWIKPGIHERAAIAFLPELRLLLTAPAETKLLQPKAGPKFRIVAKHKRGVLDVFHLPDDPDPVAAIQDRIEVETVTKTAKAETKGLETFSARAEGVRAVAYRVGEGSVLLIARSKQLDLLARLTHSARFLDPSAVREEVVRETRIARQKAEIRIHLHEERVVQAEKIVRELLVDAPQDPELLSLAVACRREQEGSLSEDLDELYTSLGAEWTARELSAALLSEGRAYGADDYVKAAAALERAALVWPSETSAAEAQSFFEEGAKAAFKAGEAGKAWARLARARGVAFDPSVVDAVELDLRLASADGYLKRKKPDLARKEARRAYELGAPAPRVDLIYTNAERVQIALERASKAKKRRTSGGFSFGLPPSQFGSRQGRVRQTAFTQRTRTSRRRARRFQTRGRRFRSARRAAGRRRVRNYFANQGGSGRTRVRSRGSTVFGSR